MHNPRSVRGNDTHKLLSKFAIKTNTQVSARRPDLVIVNNNKKREPAE